MLDDLRDATALIAVASWQHEPPGITVPSWEREAGEHQAILKAAGEGDTSRAAGLLRAHIAAFFDRNFTGDPPAPSKENKP
jgi:DNA-binding GntR family transcriptional regulator